MSQKEIAWDLSEMFKDSDDPKIAQVLNKLEKQVDEFIKDYKGKINQPEFSAYDLLKLLEKQEDFRADFMEFNTFARLSFAANMKIPEIQVLFNKAQEFSAKIGAQLAFLEIEMGKYVYENEQVISDPKLENYKHGLDKLKRAYPHRLTEIEEQLIIEKDQYGVIGWQQLQSKWLNTRLFDVEVEGEHKQLPYGVANGLLAHPDKATRKSANKAIYGPVSYTHLTLPTTPYV